MMEASAMQQKLEHHSYKRSKDKIQACLKITNTLTAKTAANGEILALAQTVLVVAVFAATKQGWQSRWMILGPEVASQDGGRLLVVVLTVRVM